MAPGCMRLAEGTGLKEQVRCGLLLGLGRILVGHMVEVIQRLHMEVAGHVGSLPVVEDRSRLEQIHHRRVPMGESMVSVPGMGMDHRMELEIVQVLRMEAEAARIAVAVVGSRIGCRRAGTGYPKGRS